MHGREHEERVRDRRLLAVAIQEPAVLIQDKNETLAAA
jgi:hypothetical protein